MDLLEESKQTAESLKKLNEEVKENLKRLEELKAREILGGKSDAGTKQEVKKEISPKEYAEKVLKGEIPLN